MHLLPCFGFLLSWYVIILFTPVNWRHILYNRWQTLVLIKCASAQWIQEKEISKTPPMSSVSGEPSVSFLNEHSLQNMAPFPCCYTDLGFTSHLWSCPSDKGNGKVSYISSRTEVLISLLFPVPDSKEGSEEGRWRGPLGGDRFGMYRYKSLQENLSP